MDYGNLCNQECAYPHQENTYARAYLDILPGIEALRKRLTKIMTAKRTGHSALTFRGGQLFGMRFQPPKQQPFLVVLPAPDQPDKARVLVDPNDMDKKGTMAIDWFIPSPDGKLVAVSLSLRPPNPSVTPRHARPSCLSTVFVGGDSVFCFPGQLAVISL